MVHKNKSQLRAQGFKCYEQLKVVGDVSYSRSWTYDSRCYEELRVLEDMNELGYYELKPLYAMNNSGL